MLPRRGGAVVGSLKSRRSKLNGVKRELNGVWETCPPKRKSGGPGPPASMQRRDFRLWAGAPGGRLHQYRFPSGPDVAPSPGPRRSAFRFLWRSQYFGTPPRRPRRYPSIGSPQTTQEIVSGRVASFRSRRRSRLSLARTCARHGRQSTQYSGTRPRFRGRSKGSSQKAQTSTRAAASGRGSPLFDPACMGGVRLTRRPPYSQEGGSVTPPSRRRARDACGTPPAPRSRRSVVWAWPTPAASDGSRRSFAGGSPRRRTAACARSDD